MGKRQEHHVVRNSAGGWDVKRNNADRASIHRDNKADAVRDGREISRNQHTEFVIHDKHGVIRSSDSHGNDPNPPRDKR